MTIKIKLSELLHCEIFVKNGKCSYFKYDYTAYNCKYKIMFGINDTMVFKV